MFNPFKKAKSVVAQVARSFEPVRDVNEVIAEIHNEFDTATDRLLSEAKDIIERGDKNKIDKAERLKRIGFNNSAPVKQTEQQVSEAIQSKRDSELILYYQQYYPSNKFITEKEVERICKKYGLICGETYKYIGDIPINNLEEIEKFSLRQEDKIKRTSMDDYLDLERNRRMWGMQSRALSSLAGNWQSQIPTYEPSTPPIENHTRYITPSFKICASVKDFDMSNTTIEDGYKLANIPDPIVLQPVKGGYLIVSKWGLEGEDKDLVNEKMN
jgi:hypothetical protein